eukprot:4530965-Amphidinium_carterae.1
MIFIRDWDPFLSAASTGVTSLLPLGDALKKEISLRGLGIDRPGGGGKTPRKNSHWGAIAWLMCNTANTRGHLSRLVTAMMHKSHLGVGRECILAHGRRTMSATSRQPDIRGQQCCRQSEQAR